MSHELTEALNKVSYKYAPNLIDAWSAAYDAVMSISPSLVNDEISDIRGLAVEVADNKVLQLLKSFQTVLRP